MRVRALFVALLALPLLSCGGGTARPSPNPGATATATPTMPENSAQPVQTQSAAVPTPSPSPTTAPTAPPRTPNPTPTTPAPPLSLAGAEWSRLPTNDHVVALTFDAGGNDAGVDSILATLSAQHVTATFFLTGRWTEVYPRQAQRIAADYDVGDHTYSHPHLTQLDDVGVRREILDGEQSIANATGHDPHPLFRFPYGDSDARTLADVHALGYGGIRWTVDTLGWKGRNNGQSVDTVVQRVLAGLTPGEIVLMHVGAAEDGSTLDADALPRLIDALRAHGYGFAAVLDYAT